MTSNRTFANGRSKTWYPLSRIEGKGNSLLRRAKLSIKGSSVPGRSSFL
jgi:hypothetical protein